YKKLHRKLFGYKCSIFWVKVKMRLPCPNIDLICDEEFLHKQLPLTCITTRSIALCGQVIAVASTEDGETIGLTEAQFQLVATNLSLVIPS
ncbi:DUF3846 domain-containing protein, partial [Microcoleus sp. Pol12A5]|uniref:DUF3846 domain-containing protein n=1 Tax=Microcoleus sp. Pol12A5 TaxID=3055392 RepID=UPI003B0C2648